MLWAETTRRPASWVQLVPDPVPSNACDWPLHLHQLRAGPLGCAQLPSSGLAGSLTTNTQPACSFSLRLLHNLLDKKGK
jgi:hypothetical protein